MLSYNEPKRSNQIYLKKITDAFIALNFDDSDEEICGSEETPMETDVERAS
jgi:hypothetical protein